MAMMDFLMGSWLGIRVFIWLYMSFSFLFVAGVVIYVLREQIRRRYYELRYPERLLQVVMHYPNGFFKYFYRLVPDVDHFVFGNKIYRYDDDNIIKENNFFSKKYDDIEYIMVEGKAYLLNKELGVKSRWQKYPQLHYFYNCPEPIKFDYDSSAIKFTSTQLTEFKKNDLFTKLLTLRENAGVIMILLLVVIINALGTLFIISKMMGWIQ